MSERGYIEITLQRFSECKVDASLYYVHLRHLEGSSIQILWFPSELSQLLKEDKFDTKKKTHECLYWRRYIFKDLLFTSIGKFPTGVLYSVHLDKAQPWR